MSSFKTTCLAGASGILIATAAFATQHLDYETLTNDVRAFVDARGLDLSGVDQYAVRVRGNRITVEIEGGGVEAEYLFDYTDGGLVLRDGEEEFLRDGLSVERKWEGDDWREEVGDDDSDDDFGGDDDRDDDNDDDDDDHDSGHDDDHDDHDDDGDDHGGDDSRDDHGGRGSEDDDD